MHIFDRLEVIEMLGIDIGHDTDLGRQPHERPIGLICLHNHPPTAAKSCVRAPIVDDAAGDDSGIQPALCKDMGDQ